jgi:transcriptional regulator with XRE-family HTH domain
MDARLVGPRLREMREAAGLSQVEFAGKIGVRQNTVSRWERGDQEPTLAVVVQLAEFFGVSTDAFFEPAKPRRKRKR